MEQAYSWGVLYGRFYGTDYGIFLEIRGFICFCTLFTSGSF